jgi:hypothetical protein
MVVELTNPAAIMVCAHPRRHVIFLLLPPAVLGIMVLLLAMDALLTHPAASTVSAPSPQLVRDSKLAQEICPLLVMAALQTLLAVSKVSVHLKQLVSFLLSRNALKMDLTLITLALPPTLAASKITAHLPKLAISSLNALCRVLQTLQLTDALMTYPAVRTMFALLLRSATSPSLPVLLKDLTLNAQVYRIAVRTDPV